LYISHVAINGDGIAPRSNVHSTILDGIITHPLPSKIGSNTLGKAQPITIIDLRIYYSLIH
jgi:hypothetical protein